MNNKVFFVNLSEVENRLDPQYFFSTNNLHLANNTIFPVYPISQILDLQRGKFGHRPRNDPKLYNGQYPFIQTGDIVKACLNNSPIEFHQTLNELGLKTSRLVSEKMVVLTIAANIGYTAILDYPACFPDSLIAIKPKNPQILELEYIDIYFKFIRQYLDDLAPQAAQKNINYQQLAKIPFVVPPKERQREIIKLKYKNDILANQKLQQSQTLLNSISDYLLEQLGIIVPSVDNALNNRIFMTSFSELDERLDPNFYFHREIKMTDGNFENIELGKIAHLIKGTSLSSKNVIDGDYPVIAGGQTSPYNHHIYNFDGESITVSASGAYSGYVAYHNYPIFASDCTVIKVIENNEILPQFLFELLKLKQDEIYLLQKGAAQPHVYANDLAKIKIPLPDLPTQKSIVQHINQIRQQAQALEQEAIDLLKQTQDDIEMMILKQLA